MGLKREATTAAVIVLLAVGIGPVSAASPADLAAGLALQIVQVVSGGNWDDGGKKGYYRAVLIAPADANSGAQIFLQWVQAGKDQPVPTIAAMVPVKEVNDLHLIDATLNMEVTKANEVLLYVEPNDPSKDTMQSYSITATVPGKYTAAAGALPE